MEGEPRSIIQNHDARILSASNPCAESANAVSIRDIGWIDMDRPTESFRGWNRRCRSKFRIQIPVASTTVRDWKFISLLWNGRRNHSQQQLPTLWSGIGIVSFQCRFVYPSGRYPLYLPRCRSKRILGLREEDQSHRPIVPYGETNFAYASGNGRWQRCWFIRGTRKASRRVIQRIVVFKQSQRNHHLGNQSDAGIDDGIATECSG